MRIVAFADRSLYAQSVVDHAGWLAGASGAGIDLVQIVAPNELMTAQMPPIHPGGPVVFQDDTTLDVQVAELRAEATEQLDAARARLTALGVPDVRTHVLEGNVSQLLADTAADAAMVVMGKRGEHADLARLPLGSNFERLVRSTTTPVLAVSRQFRPIERMLVAMDLDAGAARAVETVAAGIVPPMPVQLLHVGPATDAISDEVARAAARLIPAGYPATAEIAEGIARAVVPERVVADGIGLVAMGAFSGSRLKSLIFGSLATELIRACQVPVLLCR